MRLATLTCILALSACAATGPAYQAPPPAPAGYATLVIYRFPNGYGGAYPVEFSVNTQSKVAVLDEEGYTFIWLRANGKGYVVSTGPKELGFQTSIQPTAGETYYIRYEPDAPPGSLSAGGIASIGKKIKSPLFVVPREAAQKELPKYKLQPARVQTLSVD